jgi:hypothetical protein
MQTFHFELMLSPQTELTDDLVEALHKAGCDDGTMGPCNQAASILFDRQAESAGIGHPLRDCRRAEGRLRSG